MAFKIVKGYNPPKPLIENVEPQSDLNKKYTFNNAILTGIWGTFGAITCASIFNVFNNLKHKFLKGLAFSHKNYFLDIF